jgi:hypothetical protein
VRRKTLLTAAAIVTAAGLSAVPLTAMAADQPADKAAAPAATEYVATMRSTWGNFRVHLTQENDIKDAFANLRGETQTHVNGKIVRTGPGVNTGYTWHLDPNDVGFADFSMEVCDGDVRDVGTPGRWQSDRFCPWSSRVAAMDPIN